MLVSHLAGPKGSRDPTLSLAPVARAPARADRGARRRSPRRSSASEVRALTEALADGEILLLENVRFEPGEDAATTPRSPRSLAELADLYVNDAFGAAHRAHAITEGVAHLLPSAAGRLLEREVGRSRGSSSTPRTRSWRSSAAPRWPTRSP